MNKRTSFITAAAVTGVLLAGTAAVGANIGILNAADNGDVGNLSAAVVTTPVTEPQVIDIYLDEPVDASSTTTGPTVTVPQALTQEFAVDAAGTVSVEATETGVLLDGVTAAEGWTWTSTQAGDGELVVTFTSADSEYLFYASLAADGTIAARVDEPIVQIVQVPAASSSSSNSGSSSVSSNTTRSASHDDDHYEDDDHDDHDDDHDEYEGGEDDD